MPTYEYECKSCSHTFEVFQAMSDSPLKDCPQCGREVRRLIFGGTGVIFKGSGFYVTDKSGTAKSAAKSDSVGAGDAACSDCPAKSGSGQCPATTAGSSSGAASSGAASSGEASKTEKVSKSA